VSDTNAVDLQGDTVSDEQSSAPTGGATTAGDQAPRTAGPDTDATGAVQDLEDGTDDQDADHDDADDDDADDDDADDQDADDDDADDQDADDDDSDDDDADADADGDDGAGTGEAGRTRTGRRGTPSLRRLEEEGEVAADYLEELLDIVDLDGDIDIDVENGRASVAVVAESGVDRELASLVGPQGEVLEALQELSRLAVQARTGERSRLMLDVAGFRAARRRTLEDVAAEAVERVRRDATPVRLDPMSAFERKVVHDVVAREGLLSESEGAEPARRVVVLPASA
jgi:spoIIIJ-associated protein